VTRYFFDRVNDTRKEFDFQVCEFPIAVMLRIYCLQQWYQLSDPGAEEALFGMGCNTTRCAFQRSRPGIPSRTPVPLEAARAFR
jgi:hypothetical protein